jgi:SAM-dependent methyltransferase
MNCPICESPQHAWVAAKNGYDIHRCAACSGMFIHPFPSEEEISEFYQNYHKSKQYKDKIKSKTRRARARIASLGRRGDLAFLDVGCNLGFATEAGRSLGFRALGIYIDADAIRRAQQTFPSAQFRAAAIAELAAEGAKFDVIYCSEVIEHLTDPCGFLESIRAVMADGAVVFLTTPDVGHFSLPRKLEKLVAWTTFRPPEHLIYFTRRSLGEVFRRAGFSSVKFRFGFKPTLKVVAKR